MKTKLTNRPVEQVIAAIGALDLEPIKLRVMDPELGEGWTREYAESIERAYRGHHLFNGSIRQFRFHCFLCLKVCERGTQVEAKDPLRSITATLFAFNTGLQQSI